MCKSCCSLMISAKLGNVFFKIRSFTPIPFIIVLLYFANPTWISVSLSILLITTGELLRIWAVGYAGGTTRATALGAARDLVTTGPYSYVRNPLYLGNLLLSVGVTLFANIYWLIPVLIIGYFIQYMPIIAVEERYLLESCGQVYEEYRTEVSRFLPNFRPYKNPSLHDFSWSRAFKSERRTFTAIICVIGLILVRDLV